MPKGSRYGMSKNAPHGRGRKSRKKPRAVQSTTPLASRRMPPSVSTPSAPTPSATRVQQVVPQYPHMFRDLKRIGVIAGAMLLILIILSLVL